MRHATAFVANAYVNCGSAATLDNLNDGAFTAWAWVMPTTYAGNSMVLTKDSAFPMGWWFNSEVTPVNGAMRFTGFRATTNTEMLSNEGLPLNQWSFVAAGYDDANTSDRCRIYFGGLRSPVYEVTYNLQVQGSGANQSDAGANLYVGNIQRATGAGFFRGAIAAAGIIKRRHYLGGMEELRRRTLSTLLCGKPMPQDPDAVLCLLTDSTGTMPDLSGQGNTGTPTSVNLTEAPAISLLPLVETQPHWSWMQVPSKSLPPFRQPLRFVRRSA